MIVKQWDTLTSFIEKLGRYVPHLPGLQGSPVRPFGIIGAITHKCNTECDEC